MILAGFCDSPYYVHVAGYTRPCGEFHLPEVVLMKTLYVLYDRVAGECMNILHLFPSDGAALRVVKDIVSTPGNPISEHPGDFSLLAVAQVDSHGRLGLAPSEPRVVVECASLIAEVSDASA